MNVLNQRQGFALVLPLLTAIGLFAAQPEPQPREPFVPNFMAIEEVMLSSPNGKPLAKLKKGTLVAATKVGDALDVRTENGKFGLSDSKSFNRLGSSIKIKKETKQVAESSNQFAFDLYQQARKQDGNLFFSPASISTALAMTYAGAGGQTEREMAAVLHFDPDQNPHEGFSTLLELLNSTGDRNGYSLTTANRLWGAEGCQFEDAFLRLTREKYRAELETLDFRQTEQARRTINTWIEEQTRNKIVDLIPFGVLNISTRLVLTNAIYFESSWLSDFSEKATKQAPFHLSKTEKIDATTMAQTSTFPYTVDSDAQVLSLPYRGGELSMIVVLPKEIDGLAQLEDTLTHDRFVKWMRNLKGRELVTYLPKFKMRSEFRLTEALKSMGMTSAFSEAADFSQMSNENLRVSEVVHQAFVAVDEKGTVAAAATAVAMDLSASPPPKPITFRADHPFLFMIRDNRTDAVLFMGRMLRPEVGE